MFHCLVSRKFIRRKKNFSKKHFYNGNNCQIILFFWWNIYGPFSKSVFWNFLFSSITHKKSIDFFGECQKFTWNLRCIIRHDKLQTCLTALRNIFFLIIFRLCFICSCYVVRHIWWFPGWYNDVDILFAR